MPKKKHNTASSSQHTASGTAWELAAGEPTTRRAAASPRLESEVNNRTQPSSRIIFLDCKCKCRTCPNCGGRYGYQIRQGLLTKLGMFRKPALLTLTMKRDRFDAPEEAHKYVSENGRIRLLMRWLNVSIWVWVLEFQQQSGTGWPHWHLLIDLWDVPGRRIDLNRAWALWNQKWDLGGLDLQYRRERFLTAQHAVFYITKYLLKQPKGGYPLWVLESNKTIRFFQGSGKLGAIVTAGMKSPKRVPAESTNEARKRGAMRPFIDRMAECKRRATAFYETVDSTGESYREYLGSIDITSGRLAVLPRLIDFHTPIKVEEHHAVWESGESFTSRPYIEVNNKNEALEVLEKLETELTMKDEQRKTWLSIRSQLQRIRQTNMYANREASTCGGGDEQE